MTHRDYEFFYSESEYDYWVQLMVDDFMFELGGPGDFTTELIRLCTDIDLSETQALGILHRFRESR